MPGPLPRAVRGSRPSEREDDLRVDVVRIALAIAVRGLVDETAGKEMGVARFQLHVAGDQLEAEPDLELAPDEERGEYRGYLDRLRRMVEEARAAEQEGD